MTNLMSKSLIILLLSFISFSASAQYNAIDSGIYTSVFEEDEDEPKPGEEPECD